MGDIIKWGVLVAGALLLIALIFALPIANYLDLTEFSGAINSLVSTVGGYFRSARGLINNFTSPFGATLITGILGWLLGKFLILNAIKLTTWIYHFIFK